MNLKKVFLFISIISAIDADASRIDTFYVKSQRMHKSIPNLVIVPMNYAVYNGRLPVIYLLHGAGGDYTSWSTIADLGHYADQYNLILVCPDGGTTSWYFDSPVDPTMKYETYITSELVPAVDSQYHTLATKNGRAITGLSMGGHGGLYLGFRHQDVFGACGSMSGGVDIRPFPNNWDIAKRLGTLKEHPGNWEKNTVINMLNLLGANPPKIIIDCGTGDFFYTVNKNLHTKLLTLNIPHDYTERPGVHDSAYWKNAIKYQMLYFSDVFEQNRNSIEK